MSATFRTRLVQVNQVIFDQIDIFQVNQFNRVTGLLPTDVTLALSLNNTTVSWPLVDGTTVLDTQVVSGSVYWSQLSNGAYNLRFFPNSLGHWNLSITYPGTSQIVSLDFDVVNLPLAVESSLTVGFCT